MISLNRIRNRISDFVVGDWMLDCGAFTTINKHGKYPECDSPANYARQIKRWSACGRLHAAVAQDYMCEDHVLKKTGLSIHQHQLLTISRYDAILREDVGSVYILPVLQGYAPAEYISHLQQYGIRLQYGAWVGVGSLCKRNGNPDAIFNVLRAIKNARPDLKLHGFGVKKTALKRPDIRQLLSSSDSAAWSFAARKNGGDSNSLKAATRWAQEITQA